MPAETKKESLPRTKVHNELTASRHRPRQDARDEAQMRQALRRLELISGFARDLLELENPADALDRVYERLAECFGLHFYFHFVMGASGDCLLLRACRGISRAAAQKIERLELGESVCGTVARDLKPMIVADAQHSQEPATRFIREFGISAYVCHPLVAGGRLFGTLSFGALHNTAFTDEFIETARVLSDMFAAATARRQIERELGKAHADLKDRARQLEGMVAERTAHLRETVAELEGLSYTLSHDMRAPLRTIRGFSEILFAEVADKLNPIQRELMQKVISSTGHLDRLIQDVLIYSRMSRQAVKDETVDVEKLVRQIVDERVELQFPNAEIIIESPLHRVRGREAYVTQCVANLLDNAVKFVPRNTRPRVRIWSETLPVPVAASSSDAVPIGGSDAFVRLWIEDNGIGIAPEAQERMFGIFQRMHDDKTYPGTGLGLAIVRKAVDRMGGKAGVESEPGRGSRFWLQLPAG
jgi:signal transduction histidine kinase